MSYTAVVIVCKPLKIDVLMSGKQSSVHGSTS